MDNTMDELGEAYLPGAISLLDQLDKQVLVVLRDGRTLIGILRSLDQFANILLEQTIERIHVDDSFGDMQRGIYLVRGENVVLAGEVDTTKDMSTVLRKLPIEQILVLQQKKMEKLKKLSELKRKALAKRGVNEMPVAHEDAY